MCGLNRQVLGTVVLALSIGIALILLFAGSIIDNNWITMIQLVPLFGAPIAVVVMNWASPDMTTEDERQLAWMNMGGCVLGVILSCFLGLPLVLLHTSSIKEAGFWFWISSTVVGFAGIGAYSKLTKAAEE